MLILLPFLQQYDCVALKRGPPDNTGKWSDEPCYKSSGYICQKNSGEFCITKLGIYITKIKINFLFNMLYVTVCLFVFR